MYKYFYKANSSDNNEILSTESDDIMFSEDS